jgi:excisionase family DNA binding protein
MSQEHLETVAPGHNRLAEDRGDSGQRPATAQLLTPQEIAERLQVTPEQVRSLIRSGRLVAINVGTGPKRPCYRITHRAFNDFLERKSGSAQPTHRKRPRRSVPVPDFFPDLR